MSAAPTERPTIHGYNATASITTWRTEGMAATLIDVAHRGLLAYAAEQGVTLANQFTEHTVFGYHESHGSDDPLDWSFVLCPHDDERCTTVIVTVESPEAT